MIEKISTRDMSREEWVQARRTSIGGSDAAAVLGLNPYSSPYALWAEKTGALEPQDISQKEAVRLGVFLEPYIAQRFSEETGKKVRRENYILKNTDYPWAHANVDRMIIGEKAGLECKTTSALNLRSFRGGDYPANYYCQCMHYLAITGCERWYLAVLIGNQEFRVFEILRDEDEIAALMDAEERFWRYVRDNTPPPVDGSQATSDTLDSLHTGVREESVDLTPVCGDIRQYLELKGQVKALTQRMETCANAVKAYMGNACLGAYGDLRVSWRPYASSRLDKAALGRDYPDIDLAKYSKTTAGRRFEVKG